MKTPIYRNWMLYSVVLCTLLLILYIPVSCVPKVAFLTSSVVPAARGDIAIKRDKNKNYEIQLELSYLAEPERLKPTKSAYVVWLISYESETPINIGQIVGTSRLNIKFNTVSSIKPKKIIITAEDDASTQYPSTIVVLESKDL